MMDQLGLDVNGPYGYLFIVPIGSHKQGDEIVQYSAQFKLRLPQELKDWLEKKAKAKYHTMQAEMLGLIAEAKRKDEENGEAQQA